MSERLKGLEARLPVALANRITLARRDQLQGKTRLDALAERLGRAPLLIWQRQSDRLGKAGKLLGALGYKQVLSRGYAVVRDANGQPVRQVAAARGEARLKIEFSDGRLDVVPIRAEGEEQPRPARSASTKPKPGTDQGSLF
jgi:exodeoxyribonuclease VII large subunit